MSEAWIKAAANVLLDARQHAKKIPDLPDAIRPDSIVDGYAIQRNVAKALGPIGGWKTSPSQEGLAANWASIPSTDVLANATSVPISRFGHSAIEVELEIGVVLRAALPPRRYPYSSDDVETAIGSVNVCLEILSSRYLNRTAVAVPSLVADGLSCGAIIVGSGTGNWQNVDLRSCTMTLALDDNICLPSTPTPLTAQILEAVATLANQSECLGGLDASQVIITGSRIGPFIISSPTHIAGFISGVGAVSVSLT